MREEFKEFINDCKKSILFYTFVYAILFIISKIILNILGLEYIKYVYKFSIFLILFGIVLGVIQNFIRSKSKDTRICIIVCTISIIVIGTLFWQFFALLYISFFPPEHVVEKDNKKYVAYVYSWFDTRVEYYDYINFLLVGENKRIEDFYNNVGRDVLAEDAKGLFTPTNTTYYDENGKVINVDYKIKNINSNVNEVNNNYQEYMEEIEKQEEKDKIIIPSSSDDILYKKEINENTIIRIRNLGAILAQRSIIDIEKSTDGGKTYRNQIETSDGFIQIHNGAEFIFLDENIGFINDPGLAGTDGENRGLLITTDGGKSFKDANIIHPMSIEEKNLLVKGVPYIKDGELKVQIYTINHSKYPEKTYYEFTSEDNGITWKYE